MNPDYIEARIEMNTAANRETEGGRDITSVRAWTPNAAAAAALDRAYDRAFAGFEDDYAETGD